MTSKKNKIFLSSKINAKYCSGYLIMTPQRHFQYQKTVLKPLMPDGNKKVTHA